MGYHVLNPDGSYFHSELYKDGKEFLSVVEAPEGRGEDSIVQLGFDFDSEVEMQRVFALLREGGTLRMPPGPQPRSPCAADVVDRFGVWWYLTVPGHRPPEDYDPNVPWDASMYRKP